MGNKSETMNQETVYKYIDTKLDHVNQELTQLKENQNQQVVVNTQLTSQIANSDGKLEMVVSEISVNYAKQQTILQQLNECIARQQEKQKQNLVNLEESLQKPMKQIIQQVNEKLVEVVAEQEKKIKDLEDQQHEFKNQILSMKHSIENLQQSIIKQNYVSPVKPSIKIKKQTQRAKRSNKKKNQKKGQQPSAQAGESVIIDSKIN